MNTIRLSSVLLLASAASCAWAQPQMDLTQRLSPQQLQALGLTPTQLQMLDRMLSEPQAATATSPHDTDVPTAGSVAAGPAPAPMSIGLEASAVKSRVHGEVPGWAPGTVFSLENGQQWKVLKGRMSLRKPLASPQIAVVPGIAGRWFLQVDADLPKARVYRIR